MTAVLMAFSVSDAMLLKREHAEKITLKVWEKLRIKCLATHVNSHSEIYMN